MNSDTFNLLDEFIPTQKSRAKIIRKKRAIDRLLSYSRIRLLARKAKIKRLTKLNDSFTKRSTQEVLQIICLNAIHEILSKSMFITMYRKRKVVTIQDLKYALKILNINLY